LFIWKPIRSWTIYWIFYLAFQSKFFPGLLKTDFWIFNSFVQFSNCLSLRHIRIWFNSIVFIFSPTCCFRWISGWWNYQSGILAI
jgi:hypothetical protein